MTDMGRRLLLDTHVLLWWSDDRESRLGDATRDDIWDADVVYVSIASAWELAIKVSSGKLRLDMPFQAVLDVNEFQLLPLSLAHVERVATLPRHHGDPFDRMLAAQAMHEGLTLVTHDRAFAPYAIPVSWA